MRLNNSEIGLPNIKLNGRNVEVNMTIARSKNRSFRGSTQAFVSQKQSITDPPSGILNFGKSGLCAANKHEASKKYLNLDIPNGSHSALSQHPKQVSPTVKIEKYYVPLSKKKKPMLGVLYQGTTNMNMP
jgi:hypothetical protein